MIRQKTLLIPLLLSIILGYGAFRFHAISGLSDQTIRADGTGYYSFLPAIFIYQDLSFSFLDNKELVNDDGAARVTLNNGKIVNKYSCGIAILQLPFFLLAYFLSFFNGNEITGYGPLFQQTFLIGTIFYFFLGLIYLNKILQHFKINLWII